MAILPTISNEKIRHMQTYSEGNKTTSTKTGPPIRGSPASGYSHVNLCLQSPPFPTVPAGRKIQGLWLAWFWKRSAPSRARVGLQSLHNEWHHPSRLGTHTELAFSKSKDWAACLLSTWCFSSSIYLHTWVRQGAITSTLIYMHLQSGYEVIKQERHPQGMNMFFS